MLKKFLHRFVRKRHPWRDIKFDELAEIYTSMSLRSFGFSVIGIFVPIYLYKTGVDMQSIFWFLSWIFLLRIPVAIISAFVIGRIGPKHAIAVSTLLFLIFLSMLLSYTSVGWPLIALALAFTVSNGLFFVAFDTDFSKIKDTENGGSELGWLLVFEKGGQAMGPVVGGLVASFVAPEATIVFAIIVLMLSVVPLFLSNEPVRTHQKITFKGFRPTEHLRDFVVFGALGVDKVVSNTIWPLFIAAVIFTGETYAEIGVIVGISVGVSILSARMFGKIIDGEKGVNLLKYSVVLNLFLYSSRPFVGTGGEALAVSVGNEPVMLGYRMPLIQGLFDEADHQEGYRIVYLSWTEVSGALAKLLYCGSIYALSFRFDSVELIRWSFLPIGIVGLLTLLQRFPALKKT